MFYIQKCKKEDRHITHPLYFTKEYTHNLPYTVRYNIHVHNSNLHNHHIHHRKTFYKNGKECKRFIFAFQTLAYITIWISS